MDRIVIYLTRTKRLLVFSGYLDSVPLFTTFPGSVALRASCSLKRLQQFLWDPHSAASSLVLGPGTADDAKITDGGIARRATKILTDVVQWPASKIHIGEVPKNWFDRMAAITDTFVKQSEVASMIATVGIGSMGGFGPGTVTGMDLTIPGIGTGTGTIPGGTGYGLCSRFGGPQGGAFGGMALTGEPGGLVDGARAKWGGPYYCAMRWGYATWNGHFPVPTPGAVSGAVGWWKNRKILVTNPKTHKAVCVRAADWGPGIDTRIIDLSNTAMAAIAPTGGSGNITDVPVYVCFAPAGMVCGPVDATKYGGTASAVVGSALSGSTAGGREPAIMSKGWTGKASDMVTVKAGGLSAQVAKQAAPRFTGFLNELVASGYKMSQLGGFRNGSTVKTPGGVDTGVPDNHGFGAAIDIDWGNTRDPTMNGFYSGAGPFPHKFVDAVIRPMAHKWGLWWGGDYHSIKDYMHFEVVGAPATPAEAKTVVNGTVGVPSVVTSGPASSPGGTATAPDLNTQIGDALYNANQWLGQQQWDGNLLYGVRALMNDVPVYPMIDDLMNSGLRQWCSAPNGDVIAWFPDYFGHWGTAAKMIIEDIEIEEPFTVNWSDDHLKTHMFVTGSTVGAEGMGDAAEIFRQSATAGIASVEIPELMAALFNVDAKKFADKGVSFLFKYGARTDNFPMDIITGARQEFFFACFRFMQNWSEQYSCNVSMTFMPELYPGMLAVFPRYGVQAYVSGVNHSIDMSNGGGFTTQANLTAWSTIGTQPSIKGLPRGGAL